MATLAITPSEVRSETGGGTSPGCLARWLFSEQTRSARQRRSAKWQSANSVLGSHESRETSGHAAWISKCGTTGRSLELPAIRELPRNVRCEDTPAMGSCDPIHLRVSFSALRVRPMVIAVRRSLPLRLVINVHVLQRSLNSQVKRSPPARTP